MIDRHILFAAAVVVSAATFPALFLWLWRRDRAFQAPSRSWYRLGAAAIGLVGLAFCVRLYSLPKAEPLMEPLGSLVTISVFVLIPLVSSVLWLIAARSRYGAAVGSLVTNYAVLLLWYNLAAFGHLSPPSTALPKLTFGVGSLWSLLWILPPLMILFSRGQRRWK